MHFSFLQELVLVFGLSAVVLIVCHRFRIPSLVGFLSTGVLAGPHLLALTSSKHEIETLAEVGVVLLLFTIGAEFSLRQLLSIKRLLIIGGLVQASLTVSVVILSGLLLGLPQGEAILIGFLISISSTALVLKILQERGEVDSLYGRTAFAILIFQDLLVVPVMLFVPLMSEQHTSSISPWFVLLKGVGIITAVLIAAAWLVPRLLYLVVKTRIPELFLISIMGICFAVALISQQVGLSLALGALLAGLIISESEYGHQALGNVVPFQQMFTALFFISVGMLLDIPFVMLNLETVLILTVSVVVGKTLLAIPSGLLLGFSIRTALQTGLALSQIGEFSFVLATFALRSGVLNPSHYQYILSVAVLSLAITPFLLRLSPKLIELCDKLPLPERIRNGSSAFLESGHLLTSTHPNGHVMIIGFGVNGKILAEVLESIKIPYIGLELNPERVKQERLAGRPVFYGDACNESVLQEAGVNDAKLAVVAISDPVGTRKVVAILHRLNPLLYLVVRTRLVQEVEELKSLGAHEVIPEEFEVAVEIFARVLAVYLVPKGEIENLITRVRANSYQMLRTPSRLAPALSDLKLHFPGIELMSMVVEKDSPLAGKSLLDIQFRNKYGVNLLVIKRGQEVVPNPTADTIIVEDDILVLLGSPERYEELREKYNPILRP